MRIQMFITLCLLTLSVIAGGQAAGSDKKLEVGFAKIDISGDEAVILDTLFVKAVVFRQGAMQTALVECDVRGVSYEITAPAREKAALETGIPFGNICVAATHTHMSTPHKELEPVIVQAIANAQSNLKPVKIMSGAAREFDVSFCRRYYMKDGSVMFNPMFLNPDIVKPAGPIDPEIGLVMFYRQGFPALCMMNFALHLDIVKEYGAVYQKTGRGSRNSVSADFPYWIDRSLKSDFGDGINSIFLTGCCGNINHWDFSKPGPQSGYEKSRQVGDSLYASIRRVLPALREELPSLAVRSRIMDIPLQEYTGADLAWAKQLDANRQSSKSEEVSERQAFLNKVKMRRILWLHEQKQQGRTTIPLDVQVIRLSDQTAIVTLPGEMFVEHGLMIKNFSPFKNTQVVELANNSIAYVPTRKAFEEGGYEVENSRVAPGGGEMMVEAAIKMLKELKTDAR